jgi:hypothetical protein
LDVEILVGARTAVIVVGISDLKNMAAGGE